MRNNLRSIRERLGISQRALGELCGVTQGNISACELDRQEVSPELARSLIVASCSLGHEIGFDDIYCQKP
jgi:putative transcriptional regulator